jgi:prepilin-type N-terminal cleavage/methylation domain-containing protein
MSERPRSRWQLLRDRRRARGADAGMTLPELLVAVMVTGVLVTAMATATSVMIDQSTNTKGRLNNSRSEQQVGLWVPADLASAENVSTDPAASPCGAVCPPDITIGGSNALMLSWSGYIAGTTSPVPTTTTVSYRYEQNSAGEFEVVRIACVSVAGADPTCDSITLLHEVDPPPVGTPWQPGVTVPSWVMEVGIATDPAAPDPGSGSPASADPTYHIKNGRRVTVTINGGGTIAGSGGGTDKVTLSAGGVDRQSGLSTSNVNIAPTFAATRSRCGGNFGMVVDTSGSIGSTNMASVVSGIKKFIDTFAGTPIKLQIVRFSTNASTLGTNSTYPWSRYFDMLNEADVASLKTAVGALTSTGSTNYEDAFFRMFMNSDGTTQQQLPNTLIFFTDGIPNYTRMQSTTGSAPAVASNDDIGLPAPNGNNYSQVAWNRANRIVRQFDVDVNRMIGVFVGADTALSSTWITQGAGYHLENFLQGFHYTYEKAYHYENFQRGYHMLYEYAKSGITYWKLNNGTWQSLGTNTSARNTYDAGKASSPSNYKTTVTNVGSLGTWTTTTAAYYTLNNQPAVTPDQNDGYRATKVYSSPYDAYEATTEADYLANQANAAWTATKVYSSPWTYWETTTAADYNSGTNSTSAGFRRSQSFTSPYDTWQSTTEAAYTAANTVWGNTDGWDATKVYSLPYTFHENYTTSTVSNPTILSRLITVGNAVPATPTGGPYTNAAVADMYVLPNWTQFADAINSVALAECGGTVTLQTRVGGVAAADHFTYQNSKDLTIATTSQLYRSGTFDFDLPGGQPISVDITPVNLSDLAKYAPVSWACTANGSSVPFTQTALPGSPWNKITLTVSPNQAISCIQTVALK